MFNKIKIRSIFYWYDSLIIMKPIKQGPYMHQKNNGMSQQTKIVITSQLDIRLFSLYYNILFNEN